MSGLAVKLDQVAALRAVRKGQIPDPVTAAAVAELAGADGIIVHLYQDRRHIKDRDVRILRSLVQSKLILEMASTSEMVGVALDIKPDLVTLVPEKREEFTSEGGLDLIIHRDDISETVAGSHAGADTHDATTSTHRGDAQSIIRYCRGVSGTVGAVPTKVHRIVVG